MRSILAIGFVSAFLAGTPATAKELPRAQQVHHATGCEWAGPGFIKAEGSDTCLRVGGSTRAEFSATSRKPAYLPGLPDN